MIQKFSLPLGTLLGLILGLIILIYFNETTLFLAALLLSIIYVRKIGLTDNLKVENRLLDKTIGVLFALTVSPAISTDMPLDISNGFLLQAILSTIFFFLIIKKQPSLIGRISREAKGAIAVLGDDILAGFSAGIVSSLLWQTYLQLSI